jgi:hypothetical protein
MEKFARSLAMARQLTLWPAREGELSPPAVQTKFDAYQDPIPEPSISKAEPQFRG